MKCSYWMSEIEQWMELSLENESAITPIPKPLLDHAATCPLCSARLAAAKRIAGETPFGSGEYNAEQKAEAESRIVEHVMQHISRSNDQQAPDDAGTVSDSKNIRNFQNNTEYKASKAEPYQNRRSAAWRKRIAAAAAAVFLFAAGSVFTYFFTSNDSEDYVVVHLMVTIPEAQEVAVAGDWNSWDPSSHQMQRINNEDTWELKFRLESEGEYRYQLVIDGEEWIPDPEADLHVEDGFGGMNSILDI